MNLNIIFVVTLCHLLSVFIISAEPGATYEASDHTKWNRLRKVGDSHRAEISVPFVNIDGNDDSIDLIRLDLVGDGYTRGFAHGSLLVKEIIEFTTVKVRIYIFIYSTTVCNCKTTILHIYVY